MATDDGVVNSLTQLEGQVKEKKYADIAETLAVCPIRQPKQTYLTDSTGSKTNIRIFQTVHLCPPHCPALETSSTNTRRAPHPNRS
jgi:hypothetical protein